MPNYCSECGTKIEGNPKFCSECGNKLVIDYLSINSHDEDKNNKCSKCGAYSNNLTDCATTYIFDKSIKLCEKCYLEYTNDLANIFKAINCEICGKRFGLRNKPEIFEHEGRFKKLCQSCYDLIRKERIEEQFISNKKCEKCGKENVLLFKYLDAIICDDCRMNLPKRDIATVQKHIELAGTITCPFCGEKFLPKTEKTTSTSGNIAKGAVFLPWGIVSSIKNKTYVECPHCKMKILQS